MVHDSARDRHVLFGGYARPDSAETWEFDGTDWLLRTTTGPAPRCLEGLVYDSDRRVTVLFGGTITNGQPFGDTWEWNGASWPQIPVSGPSARSAFAMAYDSRRHRTVLFGGNDSSNTPLSDTWEYDGATWTQITPSGGSPPATSYTTMSYDPVAGKCVFYANVNAWEWDGATWTRVIHGEAAHQGAQAQIYDPVQRRTVFFGGNAGDGIYPPDFWVFDGSQWTSFDPGPGPGGRNGVTFDYDSTRNAYLMFGSQGPTVNDLNNDTWAFSFPQIVPQSISFATN